MDRVLTRIHLQGKEASRPWLELRAMLRWAQDNDDAELQGQPIIAAQEDKRQRVIVQVRAITAEQESIAGEPADLNRLTARLARLDKSAVGALLHVRIDAAFIEPFELPFTELNARVKAAFLRETALTVAATDLQVVLDEAEDGRIVNQTQIGPMQPDQLNGILAFRRTDLPEQFLFVGTGRTIREVRDLSDQWLSDEAARFAVWAEERALAVGEIVRS